MKLALLLVLCGCDSLFGLDHVPPPIDAPTDAPPDSATRTIQCDYAWNVAGVAPDGTPLLSTQPPPVNYAHAAIGGTQIPIAADGTFQLTARSGQPYELMFETPQAITYFDRNADTCHITTAIFHRLNATPVTQPTPVRFDVAGTPPVNAYVRVTSTGQRTFEAATFSMTNSWSVDWNAAIELDGTRAGLLVASEGDRIYWLEMDLTTDYYAITQAAAAKVQLANGAATTITVAPSAVPQRCIHIQTTEGTIAAMMQAVAPRGPGTAYSSWAITSSNATRFGGGVENQPLAVTTHGDVTDHTAAVSYGNPYPGESDLFQQGVALAYSLTVGTGTPLTIYSSLSYYAPITGDAACTNTFTPQRPPIALAKSATVAGAVLAMDDQPLALDRSAPVPVHIDVDPGAELLVILQEASVINGATTVTSIAVYFPLAADFAIDPALLTVGHTYLLRLTTRRGFPAWQDFDYRATDYPTVNASFPTTTFTITR